MSKVIYTKELPFGKFTVYNSMPSSDDLVGVHQVHSADIIEYNGEKTSKLKADGILVFNENLKQKKFSIKTADCMPVIFIGHKGICIIHAGWMGLRDKILINKDINKIDPYYCFIGPSITVDSFEVQEDFRENFPNSPYFVQNEEILSFDLLKEATQQILINFPKVKVESSGECTLRNLKYNSYRRNKTAKRNWNIFSI
jgi:copper oxidase (laccase) domain-containing protein